MEGLLIDLTELRQHEAQWQEREKAKEKEAEENSTG
jgi:hypothetical protein